MNAWRLTLLILAAKFLYHLMPKGYALRMWRWPKEKGGGGNALVFRCPTPQYELPQDAIWNMREKGELG